MAIKTWSDWTAAAKFRRKYQSGSRYITLTPEVRESIGGTVGRVLAAYEDRDELRRLVGVGEIASDNDVLAFFDRSKTRALHAAQDKREQDFRRSLRDLTPRQRAVRMAARNLTRSVFRKAIDAVQQKETAYSDAMEILKLHQLHEGGSQR